MRYSTSIGIDAHSKKNAVCAIVANTGELRETILSEDPARLISWIRENDFPEPIGCVYESGPTGSNLARSLMDAGISCTVAATSKPSYRVDRQKNDRVDAERLARQFMAGSAHAVHVPTPEEEPLCRLSRLRGEAAADLRRAKQRASSFLLLTETEYKLAKKRWTKTFCKRAAGCEFAQPADTFAFRMKLNAVLRLEERLSEVGAEMLRIIGSNPELAARMARFTRIHGVGKVAAFSLVCEVYGFERFRSGASFASFVGLVPSESSSGKKAVRGAIAKQGNSHLRRILVEAAGCHSRPFKAVGSEDPSIPEAVRAKAGKRANRLRKRRAALGKRGLPANKAKAAVARELAEWIYRIAVLPA